jgi:hypothetical protein
MRKHRGSRSAIEAALTDGQREALADLCRGANVPPDRWDRIASWHHTFGAMALTNTITRFREAGDADDRAEWRAALLLGLSPDTVASWRRRWISYAYRPAA